MLQLKNGEAAFILKGVEDSRKEVMIKSMVNSQNTAAYLNYGSGLENMETFVKVAAEFKNSKTVRSFFSERSPYTDASYMKNKNSRRMKRNKLDLQTSQKFNSDHKQKYRHNL